MTRENDSSLAFFFILYLTGSGELSETNNQAMEKQVYDAPSTEEFIIRIENSILAGTGTVPGTGTGDGYNDEGDD